MGDHERDIRELIDKMNKQHQFSNQGQKENLNPFANNQINSTDQSPYLMENNRISNSIDQSPANPINSARPMGPPIFKQPKIKNQPQTTNYSLPAGISGNVCPECNMLHPPLAPGVKCPNAPLKVESGGEEKIVDVNKYLVSLKNIIVSQSEIKKIKDVEKLFKNIIIEITKYLEGYKE